MAPVKKRGNPQKNEANGINHSESSKNDEIYDPPRPGGPKLRKSTDPSRWRLKDVRGVQTWHYLESEKEAKEWPQSIADKWYMDQPLNLPELPLAKTPLDAVKNGLEFFQHLQQPPGNWACEYGGPMFLLPGVVIAWYVTETPIPDSVAIEMKNYLFARQHPEDGGWGLHTEAQSSVFGIGMNYVALRILGVSAEDPRLIKARGLLHSLGGAKMGPHWLKWWLTVLGVAQWGIVNPVPPELWLLPHWVPFHPYRWWIHMRQVFLPMAFIHSKGWQLKPNPLTLSLRKELFVEDWETLKWGAYRSTIHPRDDYHPKSWVLLVLFWLITNILPFVRWIWKKRAEDWSWKLIQMEDKNTDYACLAPVNGAMNLVACYVQEGGDSYSVKRHRERIPEFLWRNGEGMLVNGTNGVQCWDTAFTVQSVIDAGLAQDPKWRPMLTKALTFLEDQQIRENVDHQDICYRQQRKGAWAFSNKDQGYAVSDCISEALKAILYLQRTPGYPILIDDQRIYDAIDTLLTYQNPSGGCASYEPTRGGEWLEILNAAEVFGRIMIEYDYPECTTAVVTALSLFQRFYPDYRTKEIHDFKARAVNYIKKAQFPDGSWYGSWGICYTYAAWFALESLASIGETYENSEYSKKGCEFLLSKQRADGGWSENYMSCELMKYTENPSGSQVVMTAWACIGLLEAKYPKREPIARGIKLIMDRQQPNGEWLQEGLEGVFNKTAGIAYPNYKFYFNFKALGLYTQRYGDVPLELES